VLNAASLTFTVPSSVAMMVKTASFEARDSILEVVLSAYRTDVRFEKKG